MSKDNVLLRYDTEKIYCVFDFEGENLNLKTSKPWQFACVVGTKDKILEKHNILINWPNLRVSRDAERITRFDKQKVESLGISPENALTVINKCFTKSDFICGHNILGYDFHLYTNFCRVFGVNPYPVFENFIDTFSFFKGLPDKLDIVYTKEQDYREYQMKLYHLIYRKKGFATLAALCNYFEVPYDSAVAHDALYDVEVNHAALVKLLWKIDL